MSKHYHIPLSRYDEASSLVLNQRFSQLDLAIHNLSREREIIATAGENLGDRDAAYLAADNKLYRMSATSSAGLIRGFVNGAATTGQNTHLILGGLLNGFSGLTPFAPVYAAVSAGQVSHTKFIPSLGGVQVTIAELGFAVAADTVFIQRKPINFVRRAAMAQNAVLTLVHPADAAPHKRKSIAVMTNTVAGSSVASHASSNQDANVTLKALSTGGTLSITASGSTVNIGDIGGNDFRGAQSFVLADTGILDEIQVRLGPNTGSPTGNLTWEIRPDRAITLGEPDASIILATGTFTPVPSSTNTISVTGGNRIFLGAEVYWLILIAANQSTNNRFTWQSSTTSTYPNGNYASANNSSPTIWNQSSATDVQMSIKTVATPGNDRLEQGFQISPGNNIGTVELWLKKVGTPTGNLTVSIYSDSGGSPGTLLASSLVSLAANLSTGYGTIVFELADPLALSGSTQYHIVLDTSDSASASNYVVWGADASSPSYANGEMKSYNGTAWVAENKDAIFTVKTYPVLDPSRLRLDWWTSTFSDMVQRYGDSSGTDPNTKTSFKCLKAAGFVDVTVMVQME